MPTDATASPDQQVQGLRARFNQLADVLDAAGHGGIWEDAQENTEDLMGPEPTDLDTDYAAAWWATCYGLAEAEADAWGLAL